MADPIVIPSQDEPTLWNRYTLTGALMGALPALGVVVASAFTGGTLLATAVPGSVLALGAASMIGGAIAGGLYGKNEMEKCYYEGKTVAPPSWANNDLFDGLLAGIGLTMAVTAGLAVAFSITSGFGLGVALTSGVAGTLALGYAAGKHGYERLEQNYNTAQLQMSEFMMQHQMKSHALDRAASGSTINNSEIKILNKKLNNKNNTSHVDKYNESIDSSNVDKNLGM